MRNQNVMGQAYFLSVYVNIVRILGILLDVIPPCSSNADFSQHSLEGTAGEKTESVSSLTGPLMHLLSVAILSNPD